MSVVSLVVKIPNVGKRTIGNRETTPRARPSFVQSVIRRTKIPTRKDCWVVSASDASIKPTTLRSKATPIFFTSLGITIT